MLLILYLFFSYRFLSKHVTDVSANLNSGRAAELYISEKELQHMRYHGRINTAL